jgi:hypothetical protein
MDQPVDDTTTAFPASDKTPGQAESRNAYQAFTEDEIHPQWWDEYLVLRSEGWDWRKAAYIAWASSVVMLRWPKTQAELASKVLGLRSDRTIQKWRADDPSIDERVAKLQVEPLLRHRRDVIEALVTSAMSPDPKSHPDRKMFLEMTGDYKQKSVTALTGENGGPVEFEDVGLTDEERSQRIVALLEAARARRDRSAAEDGQLDLETATGSPDDGVLQPGE